MPRSNSVSTKLQRIAELAQKAPDMAFTSLAHHIDHDFLKEAFLRTRKDGAPGVDGQTAADYEADLDENLRTLLDRLKSGTYRAPPVRRVEIPKGDGKSTRPIGIPSLEDKVLQRALTMLLEAVYEQDFLDCSYGFRPGRSAHGALQRLWDGLMKMGGGWVLDGDIKSFFDDLDHKHLRSFLDQRINDGVIRRTIGKWLNAGVMEKGNISYPGAGTPQGGVVSPLLANVYLHEVLDKWFEEVVQPRMRGRSFLIRYADDFVLVFEHEDDARKILKVLPERFGKFGLTLHPEKTRLVHFRPPQGGRKRPVGPDEGGRPTFDLLGFTHMWSKSRAGRWFVQRQTSRSRFRRAVKSVSVWLRRHRHDPIATQHEKLNRKIAGHCAYYGITGNGRMLQNFRYRVMGLWKKWLSRRSQRGWVTWEKFSLLLRRYPLAPARVVHSSYLPLFAAKPWS